jgi:glyoxylase-like metal-dependent hydrolase (beta-lactamase superfamily II)
MMIVKSFVVGPIGTNCYLCWDEESREAFLIDPAGGSTEIRQLIEDESLSLKYVILTHGHGDHIGAVPELLSAFPGARLAAGEKEFPLLEDSRINFSEEIIGRGISLKPDLALHDGDVLDVGVMRLSIIETPGHTPGGISILADGKLFSGDTLFRASIGRTDFPGGNYKLLISVIRDKLFTLPDEVQVFPGHMSATSIEFERKYNPFIKEKKYNPTVIK